MESKLKNASFYPFIHHVGSFTEPFFAILVVCLFFYLLYWMQFLPDIKLLKLFWVFSWHILAFWNCWKEFKKKLPETKLWKCYLSVSIGFNNLIFIEYFLKIVVNILFNAYLFLQIFVFKHLQFARAPDCKRSCICNAIICV